MGDSVAHNIAMLRVENKTELRISTKKAYSSVYNKTARFPANNVKDVIEKALNDNEFKDDKF